MFLIQLCINNKLLWYYQWMEALPSTRMVLFIKRYTKRLSWHSAGYLPMVWYGMVPPYCCLHFFFVQMV